LCDGKLSRPLAPALNVNHMRQKQLSLLITATVIGLGAMGLWQWLPSKAETEEVLEGASAIPSDEVHLTAEKLKSANIETGIVGTQLLQPTLTLPGRLTYDDEMHVAVESACQGIISELRVRPGEDVKQGQVVAVISSPSVAAARAQVRSTIAALNLSRQQRQRSQDICSGVEELIELVRAGKSPEEIEQSLKDEALGSYREKLVTAYTRNLLAQYAAESSRSAAERGAIAARLQVERESEKQAAGAAIEAVVEQSLYEVQRSCGESAAHLADAERAVQIGMQNLATLLGPAAAATTIEQLENLSDETLSLVELVSPIDGTVEERLLATAERVDAQQPVFVIANTSRLWAVAAVRQSDWVVMSSQPGDAVKVDVPAANLNTPLDGEVLMIGRVVDRGTGAAELITRLSVDTPSLRPGLFARLTLAVGEARNVLAVPESAVVVHEGQAFVFVALNASNFRRMDVTTGVTIDGQIEIIDGLVEGSRVVMNGVFKLKSELLLAGEEE
jgi:membrane fusion protein, heavy metal efflux system